MKRVIITGPTGSIGSAMCNILTSNGCEVYAICRVGSPNIKNLKSHKNLHIVECDVSNLLSLRNILSKGYDAFYHLAWSGTIGMGRNDVDAQLDNIKYTLDATLLAKELDCKVFIGAGSQAEYGHFSQAANSDTNTVPFTLYGAAKLSAGQMSRVYANNLGIKHIWTRIFSVYGPNDDSNTLISYVVNELLKGQSPNVTKCEQIWDYLYSYDAAKALIFIAQKGKNNKIYCIGSGEKKSLKEYLAELNQIINPDVKINFGEKPYSKDQVMFLSADISDLKKDTDFFPTYSFTEGINELLNSREEKDFESKSLRLYS